MGSRLDWLRSGGRRRPRWAPFLGLLLSLAVLTGCSYPSSEPGLFRTQAPTDGPTDDFPAPTQGPPEPTDPQLPVAGEAVWTSSEGLRLTSRIGVHAVRRMPGATVLDWSITPISAPGLEWGEKVPSTVDLGLGRTTGGDVNAVLVDGSSGRVYRPLQHRSRSQFNHCLCTPPWVVNLGLRVGETRLLQVSFPALPAKMRFIDVSLATLPVFSRLPVTPPGQVPTAAAPTDLQRPADEPAPLAPPFPVSEKNNWPQRLQSIQVDAIEAGPRLTSLRWTLRSLSQITTGNVYPAGPPITAPARPDSAPLNPSTASGPLLRAGGRTLPVLMMSYAVGGRRRVECLCTGFGPWATTLRLSGGRASVTSVYPPLPAGTRVVDVVLPEATTIWRLPVSGAPDGSARLGPPRTEPVDRWEYRMDQPPAGWATTDWPTPLPDPAQLRDYEMFVERLLPSSSR